MQRIDIIPNRAELDSFSFIEVSFVLRNSPWFRLHNAAFAIKFFHILFAVSPVPFHAQKFVVRISFRWCAAAGCREIAEAIDDQYRAPCTDRSLQCTPRS